MSAPLVPSPLDYLGRRQFVLFPAIANAGPNAWLRGRSSWSEAQLVNAITGQDVWVPWQYICGVSDRADMEPVVELKEDLEFRDGNVLPRVKRVIPMPTIELPCERRRGRRGPAPVVGIRTQSSEAETGFQKAGKVVLLIAALCVLAGLVMRVFKL